MLGRLGGQDGGRGGRADRCLESQRLGNRSDGHPSGGTTGPGVSGQVVCGASVARVSTKGRMSAQRAVGADIYL